MARSDSTSAHRRRPRRLVKNCVETTHWRIRVDATFWHEKQRDQGSLSASLTIRFRGLFDRLGDAHIGAAATDIARHRVIDLGVGRVWVARQQRRSRHDLARLAVAALWNFPVEPGFL